MKGVVLAGGLGTRMQPATFTTNKHLLPVYTDGGAYPMIEYPINALKDAGCREILIITSQEHCGIIVDYLGDGSDRDLDFTYKIQDMNNPKNPPGIASALKLCQGFTGEEDFIVILGDNFYERDPIIPKKIYEWSISDNKCGLFLKQTDEWERFGVAKFNDDRHFPRVVDIIEKPTKFISNRAVTGMYYYTKDVYDIAASSKVSKRGELEITDINRYYAKIGSIDYHTLEGFWSDMGTPDSMLQTIEFLNS